MTHTSALPPPLKNLPHANFNRAKTSWVVRGEEHLMSVVKDNLRDFDKKERERIFWSMLKYCHWQRDHL
jgi:hypothetical protein